MAPALTVAKGLGLFCALARATCPASVSSQFSQAAVASGFVLFLLIPSQPPMLMSSTGLPVESGIANQPSSWPVFLNASWKTARSQVPSTDMAALPDATAAAIAENVVV